MSQAFCSALPVSYSNIPSERWKSFAVLVLEGAYEATMWAAVINARHSGSNVLFLTRLGGGAFGNETQWIDDAMRRALTKVVDVSLDVRIVSYGKPDPALERLVTEFARVTIQFVTSSTGFDCRSIRPPPRTKPGPPRTKGSIQRHR